MNKLLTLSLLSGAMLFTAGCLTTNNDTAKSDTTSDQAVDEAALLDDFMDEEVEIVTTDEYGKDLEQVERYPESIRSYYEAYDDEIIVTYQTTDTQEQVREYYNELLPQSGWELDGESTDYMEYIRTTDAGEDEYITLYLYEYTNPAITEYELDYEPPYTESDGDSAADDELIDLELE